MAFPSRRETGAQRAGRYKAAHAALEPGEASAAPAWAAVAKGCVEALGELPEGSNLGFVYATDVLGGDLGRIVTFPRDRRGIARWIGTVGPAVMASALQYSAPPDLSVLLAALPA